MPPPTCTCRNKGDRAIRHLSNTLILFVSAFFDGLIDEVYIFDRALSDTEVADLFNDVLR